MKANLQKMNQVRVKMPVYETKDYSIFKRLENNRIVTEKRTMSLVTSLDEKPLDIPIACNEYLEIIDGQGRFEARKKLGLPIQFIILKGAGIEDCTILNRYNEKWKPGDWIDRWSKDENRDIADNYIRLKVFMKEYKVGYTRALKLAGHRSNDGVVEDGKVIFSEEDVEKAKDCIAKGQEIIEALCFTGRTNDAFWNSVRVCINTEGYDHRHMIEKCKKNRSSYSQMSGMKDQLKEFSRIYNSGRSKTKGIYFEDYMRNKGYSVRTYDEMRQQPDREDVSTIGKSKQEAES